MIEGKGGEVDFKSVWLTEIVPEEEAGFRVDVGVRRVRNEDGIFEAR